MCDYRRPNLATLRYVGPSPKIRATLRRVAGFRYGSLADFFNGFYHLELTARAWEALAVVSKWGLFEWFCLPFGPVNGPQAFQAAMEKAFCSGGAGHRQRTVSIDDVTVCTGRAARL